MSVSVEDFEALEARVAIQEDLTGPDGRLDMVAGSIAEFREEASTNFREVRAAQVEQQRTLDMHTGKLSKIDSHLTHLDVDLMALAGKVRDHTAQFTGRVERLHEEVTLIRDNVTVIEVNLAEVKDDVTGLKGDVTGLKADMAEVKGALAEILDRLPKAA